MESILAILSLVTIVAFVISLSLDPISGLLVDFLPEKWRINLRWILGIAAIVSTVAYIIIGLKN